MSPDSNLLSSCKQRPYFSVLLADSVCLELIKRYLFLSLLDRFVSGMTLLVHKIQIDLRVLVVQLMATMAVMGRSSGVYISKLLCTLSFEFPVGMPPMDIFLPFHCNIVVRRDHVPQIFPVSRLGLQCLIIFLPNILLNSLFLLGRAFLRCLLLGHSTNAWNPSQPPAHHPTCCGIDL